MKKTSRYPLRIPSNLQEKIKYTSSFNGRSKNKEIETAIKRYILDFERLYGTIEVENKQNDNKESAEILR